MLFVVTIISAIALGLAFPYTALTWMPYGFLFFFALMLAAGFSVAPRRAVHFRAHAPALLVALFLCFVFLPLLQLTLARFLISDRHYLAGIYFGALAPVAIVAPFFTRAVQGDEEFAHLLMVASSALFPFAAFAMLLTLPLGGLPLDLLPLAKGMVLLVVLPVALSLAANHFLRGLRPRLERFLPLINSACLGALVFILFGSASGRLNFSYASGPELGKLLALGFFQDFGVLLLLAWLAPKFLPPRTARALAVSLSMKNTAISATLLLFYSPNTAVPATLIFVPHALLFGLLPRLGGFFRPLTR